MQPNERRGHSKTTWDMILDFFAPLSNREFYFIRVINPIPRGVWNYVNPWGGAIMARIDFKLYKSLKTLLSAHNLLSKQYFDL